MKILPLLIHLLATDVMSSEAVEDNATNNFQSNEKVLAIKSYRNDSVYLFSLTDKSSIEVPVSDMPAAEFVGVYGLNERGQLIIAYMDEYRAISRSSVKLDPKYIIKKVSVDGCLVINKPKDYVSNGSMGICRK